MEGRMEVLENGALLRLGEVKVEADKLTAEVVAKGRGFNELMISLFLKSIQLIDW